MCFFGQNITPLCREFFQILPSLNIGHARVPSTARAERIKTPLLRCLQRAVTDDLPAGTER